MNTTTIFEEAELVFCESTLVHAADLSEPAGLAQQTGCVTIGASEVERRFSRV
jgi:hypothetical protein